MFEILSTVFKYVFILIIYMFIFSIIRLIYLDIRNMTITGSETGAYVSLVNKNKGIHLGLREFYPVNDRLSFGRKSKNDVVIREKYISGEHFLIVKDDGQYYLEDLNSSNGTYINGLLVDDVAKIYNGDKISIGDIEFMFINRE